MDLFQNPNDRIDQVEKDEERRVAEVDRLEEEKKPAEEPEAEQPNAEEPNAEEPSNERLQPPSPDQPR